MGEVNLERWVEVAGFDIDMYTNIIKYSKRVSSCEAGIDPSYLSYSSK